MGGAQFKSDVAEFVFRLRPKSNPPPPIRISQKIWAPQPFFLIFFKPLAPPSAAKIPGRGSFPAIAPMTETRTHDDPQRIHGKHAAPCRARPPPHPPGRHL